MLVDVMLVSTQELLTTAQGINLLNALSLQLGSSSAAALMRVGDTLVLSGVSEKETSSSRTGVPGLQEVPLVQ